MLDADMADLEYDKLPVGQVSNDTIRRASETLDKIEQELLSDIGQLDRCKEMSNHYYSMIPRDFGFTQMAVRSLTFFPQRCSQFGHHDRTSLDLSNTR